MTLGSVSRSRKMGSVQGFTGEVVRVRLTAGAGAPSSLVAKFPAPDPKRRALVVKLRYAQREAALYTHVAPESPLRMPRCYYSAVDPGGDSVLLLEDLGSDTCLGQQGDECSVEQAERIVDHMAAFHASWMRDGAAETLRWLPSFDLAVESTHALYRRSWAAAYRQKLEAALPELAQRPEERWLAARIDSGLTDMKRRMASAPNTIVHLDFRLDNIFELPTDEGPRPALIDWENAMRGRGPLDLAAFLVTSLSPERRRSCEANLRARYHAGLLEHGVTGYDVETYEEDFRLGVLNSYLIVRIGKIKQVAEVSMRRHRRPITWPATPSWRGPTCPQAWPEPRSWSSSSASNNAASRLFFRMSRTTTATIAPTTRTTPRMAAAITSVPIPSAIRSTSSATRWAF